MENKIYKCECGKQFTNPQSFNGHKGHCEIHLKLNNKLYVKDSIENSLKLAGKKGSKSHSLNCKIKKQQLLEQWISEKHTCEKCGKVMTEKFGSGRFCSRSCANSRILDNECKNKISNSIRITYLSIVDNNKNLYYNNPKHCLNCNNIIAYDIRHRKFCCDECENTFRSELAIKNNFGGITKGHGNGISGKYKGIKCDSTYELLYVVYCLDHNINIQRNNLFFNYVSYDNKIHKFYPDFYLPDSKTFVEIKGYYQENTLYKLKAMQEQKINFKLLYWEDIEYMLEYIKSQYNLSYTSLRKLYD